MLEGAEFLSAFRRQERYSAHVGFYLGGAAQAAFCWNSGLGIFDFSRDFFASANSAYILNGVAINTGGACRASGLMGISAGSNFGVAIGVSPYVGEIDIVRNGDAELPSAFVAVAGVAMIDERSCRQRSR